VTLADGFLLAACLCLLAGAGSVILGALGLRDIWRLRHRGVRVPGVVVAFRQVTVGEGAAVRPVLRFRTRDGRDIETLSTMSRAPRRRKDHPGQRASVIYDPADPARAVAGGLSRAAELPGILAIVAGSGFLTGFGVFLAVGLLLR
jgi:hypothetical protein